MKTPAAIEARAATGGASRTGSVSRSLDDRIDGLLTGVKWLGSTLTYSDPDSGSDYGGSYPEPLSDFRRINADQLVSVRAILNGDGLPPELAGFSVQGMTNLTLRYAGGGSGAATLRFANTSDPDTAYAIPPNDDPSGGDVFFGSSGLFPGLGNYHHHTILHEIGHALGLKHGHERYFRFGTLPFDQDSMEYSVMTYRPYVGANPDDGGFSIEDYGFAQTLMMFDIAALQYLYGADYSTNSGDTVYSWNRRTGQTVVDGVAAPAPGENRIFLTVWDGGGTDTYDLSSYRTDLDINLAPGGHSTFSAGQRAFLGGGPNGGFARGNVFNALLHEGDPRSLIENATGGAGADTIRGNAAANRLQGGAGDDWLRGYDGADRLYGAAGADRIAGGGGPDVLVGGLGSDVFRFLAPRDSQSGGRDLITAGDGAVAFESPGGRAGDLIDLSAIDANGSIAGDQDFRFGLATGTGRLWLVDSGERTLVRANLDARPGWEFELAIADAGADASLYSAADFIL